VLNIEIINKDDSSFLRKAENFCLQPLRYLFNGRTYEILNHQIVKDAPYDDNRSYIKVAVAVADWADCWVNS
jgi:hypothetical protein